MAELQPFIMFHGRHFVRHLGIYKPICVKLLHIISDVIPRNLKKKRLLYLKLFPGVHKRGIHTDTHRHTQTHIHKHTHTTIAIGEMQCVAFRLKTYFELRCISNVIHIFIQHNNVYQLRYIYVNLFRKFLQNYAKFSFVTLAQCRRLQR